MEQIDITRNGRLSAAIAVIAAALAVAFLVRSGGATDLVIGLILLVIAAAQGYTAWDARLPLLIADAQGIRLRLGRTWAGLPWEGLDEVEHLPRSGWLRDGKLVLLPRDEEQVLASLAPAARRQTVLTEKLYGAPLVLPLGITTRVRGVVGSLSSQLADLSRGATSIVEIDPDAVDGTVQSVSEPVTEAVAATVAAPVAAPVVEPVAVQVAEAVAERVTDPVVGPVITAARSNVGLSVEQLSERTRIRPHIISAIEGDDFSVCGGDFYARGHLRTLARVLGLDGASLVGQYDELYADGPGARVFEPELAGLTGTTGGALRTTKSGPNWSVLVAAVMSVVLLWSVARLVFDGATPAPTPSIGLSSGSSGTTNPYGKTADAVPVVVTAASGGAEVVVRGAGGSVVFSGSLAFGQSKTLKASPPIRVQSSDGSVTVSVNGGKASAVGETGVAGQRIYAGTHE
ncbi:helix-turn-helix domain-containing protein [Nocardioides sp.]|uniref:helix-turn-helix domain-containing protein n=1 Tax=Nocardioides sp. TaxID=35761 RepID=UPI00262B53DF|nr:helix-turn-helix domain-containing protein [Nocardioides sp.]